jgi:hypothetical protein
LLLLLHRSFVQSVVLPEFVICSAMEAYFLFARGKESIVRCEEEDEDIGCPSSSFTSASDDVELSDDASSSGSTTAHFEMASLMTQLPIKYARVFAALAIVGALLPFQIEKKRSRDL